MKVMPSIDISEGKSVKRVRGLRGSGLVLGDPLKIAKEILDEGYDSVHIVDLDSAEGTGNNEQVIKEICKLGFKWVQVGGGIRSVDKAESLASICNAIVLSTLPVTNPKLFDLILERVGKDKVLISIDYDQQGYVLIRGWKEKSNIKVLDLVTLDVRGFIFTYVPNEGTKGGIDENVKNYTPLVKGLKEYAGGISSLGDLLKLKSYGFHYGIVGMSFYNGSLRGVKIV